MYSHAPPVVVRTNPLRMCLPNVPTFLMTRCRVAMRAGYAA